MLAVRTSCAVLLAAFSLARAGTAWCAPESVLLQPIAGGEVHRFWTGLGDGSSWTDPLNWTPQGVPAVEDEAVIAPAFPDTVPNVARGVEVVLGTDAAVAGLRIEAGPGRAALRLQAGNLSVSREVSNEGLLVIGEGATLVLGAGSVFRNRSGGELRLEGGDVAGDGSLVNDGLLMKTDPEGRSRAFSSIAVALENGSEDPGDGAIIVESGTLSVEKEFANDGSVLLKEGAETLFDPSGVLLEGVPMRNHGLVVVEEGAIFRFPDAADGLANEPGGEIRLRGGTLAGAGLLENAGLVSAEGDELLRSRRSTVAMPGENRAEDPGDGAIRVGPGADLGLEEDLLNEGHVTVDSGGTLDLEPAAKDGTPPLLENRGSLAIASGGTFVDGAGVFVGLAGEVRIGGKASVAPGAIWSQRGRTVIEEGGSLAVETDGRAAGVFENEGLVDLAAGASVENRGSFLHNENGMLAGVGTFVTDQGSFVADGIFEPGAPVGTLAFVGDLDLGATSEVWIHLRGTVPGSEYDRLLVDGAVVLSGALKVVLLDFEPRLGDRFDVIAGSRSAARTSVTCYGGLDLPGSLYLEPVEESNALALVAVDSISGNASPRAVFDVGWTEAGVPVVLPLIENDSDPDGDPIRIVGAGSGGTTGYVKIDGGDSSVTYTPADGFVGTDAFSYSVTDCRGGLDSAMVTVYVSSEPRSWHVPAEAATIAAGIDSASAGDTVVVARGTYAEHDLELKSGVFLRSETGLAECVTVDAGGAGRALLCDGVDPGTRVEGITFANGVADRGAGLLCRNGAAPELCRVGFVGNAATIEGGGVASDAGSEPVFRLVTFGGNEAGNRGGGLLLEGVSTLDRVVLWGNFAPDGGEAYLPLGAAASFEQATVDSAGVSGDGSATYDPATIFEDPLYCGSLPAGEAPTAEGDYRIDLRSSSFTPPDVLRGGYGVGCLGPLVFHEALYEDRAVQGNGQQTSVGGVGEVSGRTGFEARPNPASRDVRIMLAPSLRESGTLHVYDVAGRLVRSLDLAPAQSELRWDGADAGGRAAAPGVYFLRLETGVGATTQRVILVP
jgi:hypothetical protein